MSKRWTALLCFVEHCIGSATHWRWLTHPASVLLVRGCGNAALAVRLQVCDCSRCACLELPKCCPSVPQYGGENTGFCFAFDEPLSHLIYAGQCMSAGCPCCCGHCRQSLHA